jgi:PIN domain-containing protein
VKHERHGSYFAPGTEDIAWLPFVGQNGWLLITKDKRIRYNELEKAAVLRHRVRQFYFSSGNSSGREMAAMLAAALPQMVKIYRKHAPPFIASISKSGSVSLRLS